MSRNQQLISASGIILPILVVANVLLLKTAYLYDPRLYRGLIVSIPLLIWAIIQQKRETERNIKKH